MQTQGTDIFEFSDPMAYLRVVFSSAKNARKDTRLTTIAKKAGFRSPSTISMILNGRRVLTLKTAKRLSTALRLHGSKRKYFLAMAKLSAARTEDERAAAKASMFKLRALHENATFAIHQYRFLSTWYYPVLYVLAGMREVRWDPERLAEMLGRGVTAEQISEAITEMKAGGLLSEKEGCIQQLALKLSTDDEVSRLAVYHYHKQMNRFAEAALDLPLAEREMNGVTFAIPKERLAEAKECVRRFRKEMNERFSNSEAKARVVYQLNLQLFPLTKEQDE